MPGAPPQLFRLPGAEARGRFQRCVSSQREAALRCAWKGEPSGCARSCALRCQAPQGTALLRSALPLPLPLHSCALALQSRIALRACLTTCAATHATLASAMRCAHYWACCLALLALRAPSVWGGREDWASPAALSRTFASISQRHLLQTTIGFLGWPVLRGAAGELHHERQPGLLVLNLLRWNWTDRKRVAAVRDIALCSRHVCQREHVHAGVDFC